MVGILHADHVPHHHYQVRVIILNLVPGKREFQELKKLGCGHTTEFELNVILFDVKQIFAHFFLISYQNARIHFALKYTVENIPEWELEDWF